MSKVAENLALVQERIANAAAKSGRRFEDVTIIGVTKWFDSSVVREAHRLGLRNIGESYLQEAMAKYHETGDLDLTWHFIGHIQNNKARRVVQYFSLIHSLDRPKLADLICRNSSEFGRTARCLLQINVSGEPTRFGCRPFDAPDFLRFVAGLPRLEIVGLMGMAPPARSPEDVRPVFRSLRRLRDELSRLNLPHVRLDHLSMGMSGDYEVAVEEGSTMVRLGTALFGPRPTKEEYLTRGAVPRREKPPRIYPG